MSQPVVFTENGTEKIKAPNGHIVSATAMRHCLASPQTTPAGRAVLYERFGDLSALEPTKR